MEPLHRGAPRGKNTVEEKNRMLGETRRLVYSRATKLSKYDAEVRKSG
jgi:hypothetical protein